MALSPAARGAAYERACLYTLQHMLGASLTHTGGAHDRGIDLVGWWALPPARIRLLVQCKAEARRVAPAYVRELEGTVVRAAWDRTAAIDASSAADAAAALTPMPIGVLVALHGFTRAALLHAQGSRVPLALVHLGGEEGEEGAAAASAPTTFTSPAPLPCRGLVWNDAFAARVAHRVTQRWPLHGHTPTLLVDGRPI